MWILGIRRRGRDLPAVRHIWLAGATDHRENKPVNPARSGVGGEDHRGDPSHLPRSLSGPWAARGATRFNCFPSQTAQPFLNMSRLNVSRSSNVDSSRRPTVSGPRAEHSCVRSPESRTRVGRAVLSPAPVRTPRIRCPARPRRSWRAPARRSRASSSDNSKGR
jgi:hypothetical protein